MSKYFINKPKDLFLPKDWFKLKLIFVNFRILKYLFKKIYKDIKISFHFSPLLLKKLIIFCAQSFKKSHFPPYGLIFLQVSPVLFPTEDNVFSLSLMTTFYLWRSLSLLTTHGGKIDVGLTILHLFLSSGLIVGLFLSSALIFMHPFLSLSCGSFQMKNEKKKAKKEHHHAALVFLWSRHATMCCQEWQSVRDRRPSSVVEKECW